MSNIRKSIKQVLKEYTEEELYDYKPNFSADDLLKYIESEWDSEMLELIDSKIQERLRFLYTLQSVAIKKDITGFKK
jgi:predicted glycosyl hydrolase (DUF1957 family)